MKKETLTYEFMDRLLLTSVRDAGPLFKVLDSSQCQMMSLLFVAPHFTRN